MRGAFPAILDDARLGEQARSLYEDGRRLMDRIVAERLLGARAVVASAGGLGRRRHRGLGRRGAGRGRRSGRAPRRHPHAPPADGEAARPPERRPVGLHSPRSLNVRTTLAASQSPPVSARLSSRRVRGRQRRLPRHHEQGRRRPPGRGAAEWLHSEVRRKLWATPSEALDKAGIIARSIKASDRRRDTRRARTIRKRRPSSRCSTPRRAPG